MEGSSTPVPYVFIVGCARSGTTLLKRIVNAHPDIAIAPEVHWITKLFRSRVGLKIEGLVTSEMVSGFAAHKRFRELEMKKEDFLSLVGNGEAVPYPEFMMRLFELYKVLHGKRFVGNKTPPYVQSIPVLHAIWPGTKFVHLIRDGRDVCLSVLNWKKANRTVGRFVTWNEDRISTTALWWERKVQMGREGGRVLPPHLYYEMRYEALVRSPEEECAKLCAFLELPYSNAMIRFHEAHSVTSLHKGARSWMPITSGLRDWRTQMAAGDVERFEAAVGDFLNELGYCRAFERTSSEKQKHADRIRALLTQDVRSKGRLLPEQWQA